MDFIDSYLKSVTFEFSRYKGYGDATFAQLTENELHWRPSEQDNSIAIIITHLAGNMLSRWSDFLTEDGEKSWRNRDKEFEVPSKSKTALIAVWEQGWECLFSALEVVNPTNFGTLITIRGEEHTLPQAINRQLAHYASHVGQIIFIGKMIKGPHWQSLSIPKGQSGIFNKKMFGENS